MRQCYRSNTFIWRSSHPSGRMLRMPHARIFSPFTLLCLSAFTFAQSQPSPAGGSAQKHTLKATPKTVAWGYYDAAAPPVLTINSGDTVQFDTLLTSSPKRLEGAGVPADQVEQSLRDIYKELT